MNTSMVLTALIAGLATWLFMYLDARLFDAPKSKFTYFKGITFVAGLSALVVYFMKGQGQLGGGGSAGVGPMMGTAMIQGLGEEILTGMPNF